MAVDQKCDVKVGTHDPPYWTSGQMTVCTRHKEQYDASLAFQLMSWTLIIDHTSEIEFRCGCCRHFMKIDHLRSVWSQKLMLYVPIEQSWGECTYIRCEESESQKIYITGISGDDEAGIIVREDFGCIEFSPSKKEGE